MVRPFFALAGLSGVLLVSACGGGGASSTLNSQIGQCTTVAPPQLVYPAPGATGIPAVHPDLYVSYGENPGVAFNPPVLSPASGASITGAPWSVPSPGPQPPGSATPTMGPEWISAFPTLSSATTYAVKVTHTLCGITYNIGSFTTQ